MRESVFFEVRLRRFDVWQVAVWVVAGVAIVTVAAWAVAMLDSQPAPGRALVLGLAAVLALATIAVAVSLARVEAGVLSCRDGVWAFAGDAGVVRQGGLAVALDLGAFLLLRLGQDRRVSAWLPVQRRGLEREWHALRYAVFSPAPLAAGSSKASALTPE